MAWVDGEDLEQLIARSGRLPEDKLLELARQLCEGLEAAHREGIVHRDLKPRNVLLDSAGQACISDFGLAQAAGTGDDEVAGTPRYMSPEQAEGKSVDARTDLYSLGLVLYEAATGDVPFTGDSALQVMVRRLVDTPKNPKLLNPALSDHVAAAILHCLERDREQRYSNVRALLDDLIPAAAPAVAAAPPSRKRVYLIAAAIVVALAASLVVWRMVFGPGRLSGKYIAVLPFRTLSSDAGLSLASEGISDAIATHLFSISSVHLAASPEKGDLDKPLPELARKLGANLIIDGTVQSMDGRLSVIVHLVDPDTRRWLWTHNFTGARGELLNIQEQICAALIGALKLHPSDREERAAAKPTDNVAAYDLYLEGRKVLKNRRDGQAATQALGFFEQACAKDSSFALAWTGVTDASLQLYRVKKDSIWTDKALAAAEQAHRLNPNLPEVHLAMGSAYTATGRNDDAISELKDALKLAPNSDDGYCRLGRAYMAVGRSNEALDAFRRAVKTNPFYWSNHNQLGVACLRLGRNKEALAELQKVVELDPGHASAYNNIGAIYERESRFDESIQMFKRAISLQPYAGPYSNLGTEYFFLGRYQDAIPMFEKAVELSPNDEVAAGNLADAYRQAGQADKARATYDRAIALAYKQLEINPQNATALGSLARCYARKGDPAKGAEFIDRARSVDPADNELMYDEAVVQSLAGQPQQALSALERALASGYSLEEAKRDPDLKVVRGLPGFDAAVQRSSAQAARLRQ
jgi:tetratricopeptide (TPR) repeat protein